ncbi:metallophosphatase family protein [Brachybacterium sp. JHP9]|uniref:Metallophosphatase family protein n=1 Tax=Brachybacterium equifaecis TaxID=2910770 RepID=A0ABT0QWX7_9MICO|nr:metallophosphoesterase family protein [Brachybacterium equifaecis]MCL6422162.1 metallophosphatase family protein [Brachybacterium equifaecis]
MQRSAIAVISDIHGNVTALEAVLADIEARGIQRILHLGDVAGKGPRGSQAVAIVRSRCEASVRGNWEAYLSARDEPWSEELAWWRAELSSSDREWMRTLPGAIDLELGGRRIRLVHASAVDEFTRVHPQHTAAEFDGMFENSPFTADCAALDDAGWAAEGLQPSMVVYGDIHAAFLEVKDGCTLVNTGSVGNPLDEPTASYVILADAVSSLSVQHVRVPYDIEGEIAAAENLRMPGREAYAIELRTAVYRGRHGERVLSGR